MSMEKERRCKLWQRVDFPAVNSGYDVFRFQSGFVGRTGRDDIGDYYAPVLRKFQTSRQCRIDGLNTRADEGLAYRPYCFSSS